MAANMFSQFGSEVVKNNYQCIFIIYRLTNAVQFISMVRTDQLPVETLQNSKWVSTK